MMDREPKRIIRVVAVLALLGAIGLGIGGCLYYRHWSHQRARDQALLRFSEAEQRAASGVVLLRGQSYPLAKGSPLWDQLVSAIDRVLRTGPGPVTYYHPTDQATVFALVSADGERLCEVRIEDEFVQVDQFDAVIALVDLQSIVARVQDPP